MWWLLSSLVFASEPVFDYATLASTPDEIEAAMEEARGFAPDDATDVRAWTRDPYGRWVRLDDLLPDALPVPDKEPWAGLRAGHDPVPGDRDGGLAGKAIYLSQCHGWIWYDSLGGFSEQRGILFDTVEDVHNPEGMDQFLATYLENAGAATFTVKERDLQTELAIVDDGEPGYAEAGAGFAAGGQGYGDAAPYDYGENPFTSGSTRKFPADGGGKATWTVDVPARGRYAVYVAWDSAAENTSDAHYRITHPGGTIDRHFDQRVHGSTWQYVETLWLDPASPLVIELVGDGAPGWASADAVRIGGGLGDDVRRHGKTTGRPRWEEGALMHTQRNGAPASIYDPYGDGENGSDPTARSRWAAWEHPTGEDALYLSWHSNACGSCGARGTSVYTYGDDCTSGDATTGSHDFSALLQDEIVSAARTLWDASWSDRGTKRDCFAEVNPGHNAEMPAALVELAFHDTEIDTAFLKEPEFRRDVSRAMYHAIVRYYAERDGTAVHYLPEPPVAVALTNTPSGLVATWSPGLSGDPYGDPATGYLIQTSADGRAWGNPRAAASGDRVDVAPGATVFVRVIATNAGGRSFPSEVVGATRSHDGRAGVLIVGAFDRFDSGQLDWDTLPGVGVTRKLTWDRINPADVVATHGRAVAALGWPFDGVADEALPADLSSYAVVIWATGEESTADESFSTAQQAALRAYVDGGGALWATGAEILWDLDAKGSSADRAFATEVLGATMASDAAETTSVTGAGVLAGLDLSFGVDDGAPYPVEWPDVLGTSRAVIATYAGGGAAGALGDGVALFGFPFETIGDEAVQIEVTKRLLPALAPDYTPPEPVVDTDTDVPDTDTVVGDLDGHGPFGRSSLAGFGCGCDGAGAGGAWAAGVVGLLILRRRR